MEQVWKRKMEKELEKLEKQSRYRRLESVEPAEPGWMILDGRKMLNLASNDYLGLAQLPFQEAEGMPSGAAASRLITGNHNAYERFEAEFARFKKADRCLVFNCGYMANLSILSALVGRKDIVFGDRLNHASIVDGILLSRAAHMRYRHRDTEHLEFLLRRAEPGRRKWIVTDSVFSMDGSMAPLEKLVELKNRYGAVLMVDEAHSGGIYGKEGRGLAAEKGLEREVEIRMGTFGKAYGCYGAYVVGDSLLIRYLVNKARSFIYTTALPPYIINQIEHNWHMVRRDEWRRRHLLENAAWFRSCLRSFGLDTGHSETPIIPVMTGSDDKAVRLSLELRKRGLFAAAIRPPTVPEGAARVRLTLTSAHTRIDLGFALGQIRAAAEAAGVTG